MRARTTVNAKQNIWPLVLALLSILAVALVRAAEGETLQNPVGLSTQFDISVVLKGDKHLKKCVLHHFRLTNPKEMMIDGPMLASFDPKQHTRFLLFLHREADGRYAPVSGQTDPTMFSVQKLEGAAQ